MMLRLLMVAAAAIGLADGATCAPSAADRKEAARLHSTLVHNLKDAASAKVRGAFLNRNAGDARTVSYCGELNARNSYGGYAGFLGFVVTEAGMVLIESDFQPHEFRDLWDKWCSNPVLQMPEGRRR
jgi:hypothetical protein